MSKLLESLYSKRFLASLLWVRSVSTTLSNSYRHIYSYCDHWGWNRFFPTGSLILFLLFNGNSSKKFIRFPKRIILNKKINTVVSATKCLFGNVASKTVHVLAHRKKFYNDFQATVFQIFFSWDLNSYISGSLKHLSLFEIKKKRQISYLYVVKVLENNIYL